MQVGIPVSTGAHPQAIPLGLQGWWLGEVELGEGDEGCGSTIAWDVYHVVD